MKKIMILAAASMIAFAAAPAFAAGNSEQATANASATVIKPVSIAANKALRFGTLVEGYAATTVAGTDASPTRTGAGANFEIGTGTGGAFGPAVLKVDGDGTRTLDLQYGAVTGDLAGKLTLSGPSTVTLVAGTANVEVGGTLGVALAASATPYAGSFTVTATYQ